ncbi:hypothetical protein GOP47_0020618 [Adiantum capillus-veneris]|uniref:F-box/kelch-repeat protein n=1 Tax=Adiantum capillus-veneris TaxID=13818 RepID=A0A9D4UAF1_ADICA|nr:hypothetical protein GOP47_0020618 [Adiantum capillus-veneris]
MEPVRMTSIRKALNISEVCPLFISGRAYIYKDSEFLFTIVDPIRRRRRNIPLPSHLLQQRHHFDISVMGGMKSKVLIAAGAKKPYCTGRNEGIELMQGGIGWCGGDAIQGAERLDIKTKRWETLPDPHVKRTEAVGVVMGGLFYMIGGCCDFVEISRGTVKHTSLNSGEIWDPASREWTLVPELWPGELFQDRPNGRVAALGGRLYALRRVWMTEMLAEELMYYECASKTWMSMGFAPLDIADRHRYESSCVHLLKMGEELWVIHWWKWLCVAAKPTLFQPLCWWTLPHTFKRGLPLHNGDMVGELHV